MTGGHGIGSAYSGSLGSISQLRRGSDQSGLQGLPVCPSGPGMSDCPLVGCLAGGGGEEASGQEAQSLLLTPTGG